jgi:hypothetical protein
MQENEAELQPTTPSGEPDNGQSWASKGSRSEEEAAAPQAMSDVAPDDDGAAFLADLAAAMQSTAGAEHVRISEETDRRRQAHLENVRAREAAEAEDLRDAAESDVKSIDAWADGEIKRIQVERERRIVARRDELTSRLDDHRSLIGREVDAIEAAIVAYRGEIEAFFGRLGAETDPVVIAREAGRRPPFPALDVIGPDDAPAAGPIEPATMANDDDETGNAPGGIAVADEAASTAEANEPAEAGAEPLEAADAPLVGVMDRDATDAVSEPLDAEPEPVAATEPGAASGSPGQPTAAADSMAPRSSAALLSAVPTLRPMGSWFRRDGDAADRSETDG